MAFFPDLSPHTYSPTCGLTVLDVGWLGKGHAFPTGATSPQFHAALRELCEHPIILHRGYHHCEFCLEKRRDQAKGNGQIRIVRADGLWYAAPTMVYHYVVDHKYRPPQEFIDAAIAPFAVGTNYGWFEFDSRRCRQHN
jgi:hypothetical protein